MTLIQLIRKYLVISMLVVLVIGCISHFLIFRFFIHYSNDQMLDDQRKKIENFVAEHDTLSLASTLVLKPARIEQQKISDTDPYPDKVYKDTVMLSEETGLLTPYRQLYFTISYKDEHYLININQATIVPNDLFYAIISSLLILIILLLLFTYVISFLLKRNIWNPLNKNLQKLHNYDLKANTSLDLKDPGIKEFDEINHVIMKMVQKINEDYENSRLFAEDTSHEMQTPLAVIKSKFDLLIQNNSMQNDEKQSQTIQAISRAVNRLSRLNKSLLLINKINNNQFDIKKDVSIDILINDYLADMEELTEAKNLTVTVKTEPCTVYINPTLAEILISNLLSNAIRHNITGGNISIELNSSRLIIVNTSATKDNSENLFNRMTKGNQLNDSSGLGLNIVKSICDKNGLSIRYLYIEDKFEIDILF
ncbi:sensor histidine kinase [Dysgonomonas sp. 521]|uniref:sensor histidine kinase n=1 Tax=Dysgonomonas sp. 521 TaxID=2302932 RepID=UPI0013D40AE2|nr:HAMP domain-containing sensor histidine kinase [Dysgonomonas sp. 521]NDV97039.1 sensor histidine kinase [Dysgonomonas sp. 521]